MKGDAVTSSDDECPSVSGDSSVVAPIFSKEKVCELKNSCYMKKKIISAIKKSLKTNNNKIHHTLTFNDVSVSEEKEIGNGCRQSLNIRIDLNDKLFYSSPDAASVNIETFKLNDSSSVGKCSRCSDKQNLVNDENASRAYFVCVKCGKREERRWAHDNCKDKCCRSTSIHCDNCLRFRIASNDHNFDVLRNAKFSKYMYVVTCPNGGGISLHMDYEKIMNLTPDEQLYVAKEFLKEAFKEDKKGFAQFTIAIVHNGSSFMPDLLKLLAELHPTLPVKTTKLKCDTETEVMDLGTYYSKVKETYNNGTFAFGPLNETQAASVKNDECGAYLPELLSLLERSPFLSQVLPWSTEMTTKRFKSPHESDDGPIFWCRPGEQIVSLDRNSKRNRWNADEIETFLKERQQNLKSLCEKRYIVEELKKYRRSYSSREFVFEDRTKPHADQVWGNHFEPTAAVGVIQAIHPDEIPEQNRACKEIVVFHARHFEMLEALLHIDVTAAPKQQCAEWLDDAKLNMIRQMNIRYSKLHLYDNDIYFIPRKIVHQFKTISATLSVAWHTRLIDYYLEPDPPIKTDPIDEPEEQAAHSDSSSSRSSSPSPVRKKTPAKKRKLSCSENESTSTATPKKKKKPIPPKSRSPSPVATPVKKKPKPRSRSSTPLKREKPTPKKKSTTKTPKKMKPLTLDEKEPDAQAPVHHKPRSSSRSDGEEKSKMSRSSSPSQRQPTRGPESSKKSPSRSRSRSVERTESNSSPPVVRKSVDDGRVQTKSPEEHRSASRDESKKNKSRSLSASPKRNEHDGGDASDTKKKKKSKRRSRSRSKSRKSENPSDTFGEKCASSSKKKKKERSRSPKKRDKSKESKNGRDEEKKSHVAETERHSSGKHKKHDRKDSFHSRSSSPAKKHDKNKKPRHRSRSPAKHEDDKMIEVAKETSAEDQLVPESPSHSFASRSTEKPTSPLGMPNESFDDERDAPVPESMATIDKSPVSQHRPHTPTIEMNGSPDPPSVIVKEEPRSPVSTQVRVFKEEPRSPCIEPSNTQSILEDRSSLDPVHCVKPEPQSPPKSNSKFVAHDPKPIIPDPKPMTPESKPMVADPKPMIPDPKPMIHEPKSMTPDPKPMIPDPKPMTPDPKPTEAESKKPTKTVGTVKEASTGKDHRKEKLWDTPLFSFNDCDKFVLTTRPNANKNGDKIVKSKTLNSLQKTDGKRAASKSPPRLDKDRKSEPVKKTKSNEEKKNHASLDKGKSAEKARHADKKPSSSDHQQRSKDVPRKESHSSDKPPKEHDDKKSCHSSSHTKEKSADRAKEKSSHSRDRDIRKRSRSPLDKHHKHSKKHKKHRSASNSREAGNASKVEVTVDNADTATPTVVENEKTDEVANEPQSDENYAAGYRLVYPRIEIVDIGAKLKTKCDRVQDTEAESSCADEPVPVDETNVVELNSEDE